MQYPRWFQVIICGFGSIRCGICILVLTVQFLLWLILAITCKLLKQVIPKSWSFNLCGGTQRYPICYNEISNTQMQCLLWYLFIAILKLVLLISEVTELSQWYKHMKCSHRLWFFVWGSFTLLGNRECSRAINCTIFYQFRQCFGK